MNNVKERVPAYFSQKLKGMVIKHHPHSNEQQKHPYKADLGKKFSLLPVGNCTF